MSTVFVFPSYQGKQIMMEVVPRELALGGVEHNASCLHHELTTGKFHGNN